MTDELDPTVPYWCCDTGVSALYREHARHGPELDLLLDRLWLDGEPLATEFAVMRGTFHDALLPDHCYWWIFSPSADGEPCALVIPVFDGGRMVDILAVGDRERGWGCVTGRGEIAGQHHPNQRVRVYQSAWSWLLWGCDGVMPLKKSALPRLASAPLLIAESLDHMDEIAFRAFVAPTTDDDAIDAAEAMARERVGVDPERYDIDRAIFERAASEAVGELKHEGLLK